LTIQSKEYRVQKHRESGFACPESKDQTSNVLKLSAGLQCSPIKRTNRTARDIVGALEDHGQTCNDNVLV